MIDTSFGLVGDLNALLFSQAMSYVWTFLLGLMGGAALMHGCHWAWEQAAMHQGVLATERRWVVSRAAALIGARAASGERVTDALAERAVQDAIAEYEMRFGVGMGGGVIPPDRPWEH